MSNDNPTVTQDQINAVMTTITDKLGGVFVTPSAIESILEVMVAENQALAPIANTVWDVTQRMHAQTGEALTLVAMQKAMMEALTQQRDIAINNAKLEAWQSGFKDGVDMAEDTSGEWQFTFVQGVMDNRMDGLSEIQIETFAEIFYEGQLDDTAKQMLHNLIIYVNEQSEEDMGEVEF